MDLGGPSQLSKFQGLGGSEWSRTEIRWLRIDEERAVYGITSGWEELAVCEGK